MTYSTTDHPNESSVGASTKSGPKIGNIPSWLKEIDRWVLWRNSNGKKIPVHAQTGRNVNATVPGAGCTFDVALDGLRKYTVSGLGIVLGEGLVAVDLDDCLTPDRCLKDGIRDLVMQLGGGYVEVSPSMTGLHVVGYAPGIDHTGINTTVDGIRIEMYANMRYITVTGEFLPGLSVGHQKLLPGYAQLLKSVELHRGREAVPAKAPVRFTQDIHEYQEKQDDQDTKVTKETQAIRTTALQVDFEKLPSKCILTAKGSRNRACFELARWLKAEMPSAELEELKPIVQLWHQRFIQVMATKDFAETWIDFINGWNKVKFPFGVALHDVWDHLPALPDWMDASDLGEKGESLLRLCFGLANRSNVGVFYLDGHQAAILLGCTHTWAYKLLHAITALGYLEIQTKGKKGRATEYRLRRP